MHSSIPNSSVERSLPSEEEMLLAEMAYSPGFRRFIQFVVVPHVKVLREELLRNRDLGDADRRSYVYHLLELERLIGEVYAPTEAGKPPEGVQAIFR